MAVPNVAAILDPGSYTLCLTATQSPCPPPSGLVANLIPFLRAQHCLPVGTFANCPKMSLPA